MMAEPRRVYVVLGMEEMGGGAQHLEGIRAVFNDPHEARYYAARWSEEDVAKRSIPHIGSHYFVEEWEVY
ncbi:Uncharacterised protein [Mycobacteroides abscessus subsp. massiliense]|nr:Uncharacterised protein [Mycobacteroides abscessus subsp. massiliense]SKY72047.1 Uncharacterised protein [Mycobacteroides abscessus subsp. massiliense]